MSCEGALEPLSPRGRGRGLPRERWEGEGVGVRSCSIIYSVMRLRRSPSSGPCFAGATFSRVGEKGWGLAGFFPSPSWGGARGGGSAVQSLLARK